jgi:hypothetical protein
VKQVTSHADIMPTILEALGAPNKVPCYGESVLSREHPGSAIAAHYNRNHRPNIWAVITEGRKTILEGYNDLQLITLLDQNDQKVQFSDDADSWRANFLEVQRFRRALIAAVSPGAELEEAARVDPAVKTRR